MIRRCVPADYSQVHAIINDAARAYEGVIPADVCHRPYMSRAYLMREIAAGVEFWGYEERGGLKGVMGFQQVNDVTLIRHAYVSTRFREQGIGGKLLTYLRAIIDPGRQILIGTWEAAAWAIGFYEKHGFMRVSAAEKERLLRRYWTISDRQVETSVVLVDRFRNLSPIEGTKVNVLILGSFPSVLSREKNEYYGNPANRFWPIMADVLNNGRQPRGYDEKKALVIRHAIGLWDVVEQCRIIGSQDAKIVPFKFSDIAGFAGRHPELKAILLNGHAAERFFHGHFHIPGVHAGYLPQTSPAHAAISYAGKLAAWKKLTGYISAVNKR